MLIAYSYVFMSRYLPLYNTLLLVFSLEVSEAIQFPDDRTCCGDWRGVHYAVQYCTGKMMAAANQNYRFLSSGDQ